MTTPDDKLLRVLKRHLAACKSGRDSNALKFNAVKIDVPLWLGYRPDDNERMTCYRCLRRLE